MQKYIEKIYVNIPMLYLFIDTSTTFFVPIHQKQKQSSEDNVIVVIML